MGAEPLYVNDPDDTVEVIEHLMRRPDWHRHAACRGQVDVMFPKSRHNSRRWAEAIAICDGCPVRRECAQAAHVRREVHGVWGGQRRVPDPQRVRILDILADLGGWWSAPQLSDVVGLSPQSIRRRLAPHLAAGRIESRLDGQTTVYRPTGAQ